MPALAEPTPLHFQIAAELFPNQPQGFPFVDVDAGFELPAGEDFGVPDVDESELSKEADDIQAETGFGSVIVVLNLPVVPTEKYDKLAAVIKKIYGSIGTIREGGFFLPQDASGKTKGFAFIEFSTTQEAVAAKQQTDKYQLDKSHVFSVHMLDDIDKYARTPDTYTPPEPKPFKAMEGLYDWMTDKLGRDQFVIRAGDMSEVYWNDGKRQRCEEVYKRQYWTETFVQWSPLGTYITTLHRQGVAIWGGPNWERVNRFAHQGVCLLEFSPNEKFLITYSSQEPTNPRESVTVNFIVHDVRTARKQRVFQGPAYDYAIGANQGLGGALKWPVFKWSGGKDDAYFACLGKGIIKVFKTSDMRMLEPVKMDGVHDFEWSPSEPILVAYTAEEHNMPARIVLVKIPERSEIRQKNLFNVSDVSIFWHPQGDYLAVKVDRYTKTKKSTYTGFELFSIRDKDIPMDVLELPNKSEKIVSFAWEPKGHRFAVVHGDGPRFSVSFYSMRDEKNRLAPRLLGTITNKACNQVHWSPQGKHIVLAGLKGLNGQLEFFSVDEMETMAAAEHFMATDVDWDPTGRYIATSVTSIHQMENGFNLWSFQGKLLYQQSRERLFQFSWRPRLPSLLPPERDAEILKNLKQYSKRYDEEDEALLMQADADVLQERQRMADEWKAFCDKRAEYVALLDGFKRSMYGPRYEEKPFSIETVTVEQIIDQKEEPVNKDKL
ncbi:eukaryotic initiation factor [Dunaliella salina]|uniref:Eukaryotic translation initiation factor 3 subunit B n=1 Tax=Dunaliella salina TaxID=3046 RepID=A0ABQ7GBK0_DUNSA|nr:eukaryotic initiation factor [Dunaliella salina]|eukprot:KAF5831983.1 eukaryotic initiation factor [Dunaliella salina]